MAEQRKNRVTPRQKQVRTRSIAVIFFSVLSVLAILGLAAVYLYYSGENKKLRESLVRETAAQSETSYTQAELETLLEAAKDQTAADTQSEYLQKLKELMLSGDGTVSMLRFFFPDKLVYVDSGSYFIDDINEQLKKHPYLTENLVVTDQGEYEYYEDEQRVSHKGIDVSSFQGEIDWNRAAADGVEFAVIRMGIRGYGSGKLVEDEQFQTNMEGALAAGVDVGVYFFTEALDTAEAVEEAEFVLSALEPYGVKCTIVLDIEDVNSDSSRTNQLTKEQWTQNCIAFCDRVQQAGYTPMIYGNLKTFVVMLDLTQLENYEKWFAAYTPYFYYPYDFSIWQYSDAGTVDGISEPVDLNISFYDWSSMK